MNPPAKRLLFYYACTLLALFPAQSMAQQATADNDYEYSEQQEPQPTLMQQARTWWIKNKPWGERDLGELKAELHAKETMLMQMDAYIDNTINNARPRCPGGTVTVTIESDPRIELRADIDALKEKIAALEE